MERVQDVYFSLHTVHKIGVLQRYAMQFFALTSELLQAIRWRRKYNSKNLKTKLRVRAQV